MTALRPISKEKGVVNGSEREGSGATLYSLVS